jgi:hypothetical protein
MRYSVFLLAAWSLYGQRGQEGPKPEWPCVPGRAVDPAFLEVSESTGGQIFLFQKKEFAQAGPFLRADSTHPATIVRAVGSLSQPREFEFPVDSTVQSLLVMATIQCRSAIGVFRPSGTEITASSSTQNTELQTGRAMILDNPDPGQWKVRLEGTGLFLLSVRAQSPIHLSRADFLDSDGAAASEARTGRKTEPRLGVPQWAAAYLSGELSKVDLQVLDAAGDRKSESISGETIGSACFFRVAPALERFRLRVTGVDASGWPVERVYPVLFRAHQTTSKEPRP